MTELRSFRADLPVFFRIRQPVSGKFRFRCHFICDGLVRFSPEFDVQPHPAIDFRISFIGVQRFQMALRNQVQESGYRTAFQEIDVGVKPLGELVVPQNSPPQRICPRTTPRHPDRFHIGPVSKIQNQIFHAHTLHFPRGHSPRFYGDLHCHGIPNYPVRKRIMPKLYYPFIFKMLLDFLNSAISHSSREISISSCGSRTYSA